MAASAHGRSSEKTLGRCPLGLRGYFDIYDLASATDASLRDEPARLTSRSAKSCRLPVAEMCQLLRAFGDATHVFEPDSALLTHDPVTRSSAALLSGDLLRLKLA
jgi:hypothetical protein